MRGMTKAATRGVPMMGMVGNAHNALADEIKSALNQGSTRPSAVAAGRAADSSAASDAAEVAAEVLAEETSQRAELQQQGDPVHQQAQGEPTPTPKPTELSPTAFISSFATSNVSIHIVFNF